MTAGSPDVSVVVPVYNTMPYLSRCLTSLVGQTIGPQRMEVVAVDDGSTDGSGRELDRFARRHPRLFTVIHQANSGGPAGPCNRALEIARGRYVFFLGADDYLGPEALQRLVAAAEDHQSDVVLGKEVGVNGRFLYQDIFARNAIDVGLADSPLPRSLANTKLFRRELIDRHGLRYPEDRPIGSDLPFTLAACYHARRISVLADYDFYYAVRRLDATNITYLSRPADRMRAVEANVAFTVGLIEPGKEREAVLARLFDHDVAKLLADDLRAADRGTQQLICDGVARLATAYLTAEIADRLAVETRIRIAVARHGCLDDLLAVIGRDASVGVPETVVDGGRRYAAYPGFRDAARGLPDDCFEVTGAADWPAKLDATRLVWDTDAAGDRVLTVHAHTPVPADLGVRPLTVRADDIEADTAVTDRGAGGTAVRASFTISALLAGAGTGRRRTVSALSGPLDAGEGVTGAAAVPVRTPRLRRWPLPRVRRYGGRLYAVAPTGDGAGRLMISVVPVTPRRLLARAARLLRR